MRQPLRLSVQESDIQRIWILARWLLGLSPGYFMRWHEVLDAVRMPFFGRWVNITGNAVALRRVGQGDVLMY